MSEPIQLLQTYLTGNFDNAIQVAAEQAAGRQLHPFASHVNRVADDKILHKPETFNGFFLLEESYYIWPDGREQIKPMLFYFEPYGENRCRLTSFQLPVYLAMESVRNDNDSLLFDYTKLVPSLGFRGADYFLEQDLCFYTDSLHDFGNGMQFRLTEKLSPFQLVVMELLIQDGIQITPYQTPIIYERK